MVFKFQVLKAKLQSALEDMYGILSFLLPLVLKDFQDTWSSPAWFLAVTIINSNDVLGACEGGVNYVC